MKKQYRISMALALCGLMLMLLAGHIEQPRSAAASASLLIAGNGEAALYAGIQPPAGQPTRFGRDALYQGLLLFVSREHPLPADLPPQQSRDVRSLVGRYIPAGEHVSLSEETIYALCDLAQENPLPETWIVEGMRSPLEQQAMQRETFKLYQASMPVTEALALAAENVPDSGRSEHQLATAFDVQLNGRHAWSASDPMAHTQDGRWLLENAWRYGFIRRYPPDKSQITGIQNETMHWRYVGKSHAEAMRLSGLCLEEYLELLHAQGTLCLVDGEGRETWLLCRPCGPEGADFDVPEGWRAEASADNLGFAVCALTRD